ncbi:glycosyltransferase [Mycobacterium ostraviense]|nr:glycosyltransferase family 2 protein [Mycobacterium ostraviense]UGT92065.1 glycosyltransferase family 2 protein [Mycobacterium ostraviense]
MKFLLTVVVIAGMFLGLSFQHLNTVWACVVLAISIVPVYVNVYHRLLFVKGWLLHRQDLFSSPRIEPEYAELPDLALIIPSCKEPFTVAKITFDCAYRARYTGVREIIVVDNSQDTGDREFRMWKSYVESHIGLDDRVRIVFHHNTDAAGSKPGNIDRALTVIKRSKYVVFLDIDSSLPLNAELLDIAVNKFEADPNLGVLQFHTVPTNNHFNQLSRAVAIAQHSLRIGQLIRASGGFAMFYGHNAMWRRSLLQLNGSWLEHYRGNIIVTEDLLKTLGVYANGFTSRYLNISTGEWVPSSLKALEGMWMRWTYGGFQVLFKYFRHIASAKGLSFTQRVDLLTLLVSYAASPLIYPAMFLWFTAFPPGQVAVMTFVINFFPPMLYAGFLWHHHGSVVRLPLIKRVWDLYSGMFLIESFISAVQIRAVVNFMVGKKQGWRITSKAGEEKPRALQVLLHNTLIVTIATLAIAALIVGGWRSELAPNVVISYLVVALIPMQLLLCVIVYGGQVQNRHETITDATIDGLVMRRLSSFAC